MTNDLNFLSTRAGFNTALRHFKIVSRYLSEMSEGENLADLINDSLDEKEIGRHQIKSIINALAVDKFGYRYISHNLEENISEKDRIENISNSISKWGNIQFIMTYYNPGEGVFVINPKKKSQWEIILPLISDELVVIYANTNTQNDKAEINRNIAESAIRDFIQILYRKKVKPKKDYLGVEEKKEEAPVTQAAAPRRRATPRYSVQVTNELFHNGNVEAWKKIIESYKSKYPDLDVMIWYDNERINDINALFKWGKVKHGGLIFFSVVGENIKDVSKLQRYLFEGASPRFEAFLKGGIGKVLDLF